MILSHLQEEQMLGVPLRKGRGKVRQGQLPTCEVEFKVRLPLRFEELLPLPTAFWSELVSPEEQQVAEKCFRQRSLACVLRL